MASFGYGVEKDTCHDSKSCVFAITDDGRVIFRCQTCNVGSTYESVYDGDGSGSSVANEIATKNRMEFEGNGDEGLGFYCAKREHFEEFIWPEEHVWNACKEGPADPDNLDCKHICNWQDNPHGSYGFCEDGYDFYEEQIDDEWGEWAACATICVPDDGYDWSMIEDMTGVELSQEDIDQLNNLVGTVSDHTQLSTRLFLRSSIISVFALMMSQ